MSKSYDNTIPLWLPAKGLRKAILGIVTDSRAPGEAKDADTSNIFAIYQAFASADETAAMRNAFADGIAWGDAKQKLFERLDAELAPARERYDALVARPQEIEDRLLAGAEKARERSRAFIEKLRWAVGVRKLTDRAGAGDATKSRDASAALPQLKSYREKDGRFYFKLTAADGTLLVQSRAFDSPKDAGRASAALIDAGDNEAAARALLADIADGAANDAALAALAEIKASRA
jgi:tryptophanyl-tRNA synthetase